MATYKEVVLNEGFANLFIRDKDKRQEIADEVYQMFQKAYKPIGGLLTNGFQSPKAMVDKIPFWKIAKTKGKIVAAIMYKDKGGRKSVAASTDGSIEGKKRLKEMLKQEFTRSFGEKSGPILRFVKKAYPDLVKKYAIPAKDVAGILNAKEGEIELIKGEKYTYVHNFHGTKIEKMMLGTPGKTIK